MILMTVLFPRLENNSGYPDATKACTYIASAFSILDIALGWVATQHEQAKRRKGKAWK